MVALYEVKQVSFQCQFHEKVNMMLICKEIIELDKVRMIKARLYFDLASNLALYLFFLLRWKALNLLLFDDFQSS